MNISESFLFQNISSEQLSQCLSDLSPIHTYSKGMMILSPEEPLHAIGFLLTGEASVFTHRVLRKTAYPGDFFGVASLFSNEPFVTSIQAKTTTEVQFIEEEVLQKWMKQDFQIAQNYISFLTKKIRFLNHQIDYYTENETSTKLFSYLKSHANSEGWVPISNMAELAQKIGMGRSSLYRNVDRMEAEGILLKLDGGIQIKEH